MTRLALVLVGVAFAVGCGHRTEDASSKALAATTAEEAPAIVVDPFAPPALSPEAESLRVLIGGDLIPHRPSLAAPSAVLSALSPLAPIFGTADAVVANYEAATGELDKNAFRLAYAAPPAWLDALPQAGINAVTIANNHACDLGRDGVEATIEAGKKSGLTVLGGDENGNPWAPRTLASRNGKRVCAVAWTTIINAEGSCAKTTHLAVATENAVGRQKVATAIQRARAACDATIAIIHGGIEYVPQTPAVMAIARQAADSGADAVVIHHPHVASPVVVHSTKDGRTIPIFASVGNLVSNQGESWKPPMFPVLRDNRRLVCVNGWTRLGVLADLTFDFDGAPKLSWGFHLLWTDNEHAEDKAPVPKIATRLLDPEKDAAILSRLSDDPMGPIDLFDDPCWVERPIYTDGDRLEGTTCRGAACEPADHPRDARCRTTLVRGPLQARPALARAKKKR